MYFTNQIQMIQVDVNQQFQTQASFNNGMQSMLPFIALKPKKPAFKPHSKFNEDEDERLRELVSEYGDNSWIQVATQMPGRNSRQCRERWLNYLSPKLNTNDWTQEEDELLLEKQKELGTSWVRICKFFEGRTDQMCKNRYYLLRRKIDKKVNKRKDISPQCSSFNNLNTNAFVPFFNAFQSASLSNQSSSEPSCTSSPIQIETKSHDFIPEQQKIDQKKKDDEIQVPVVSETTDVCYLDRIYQDPFENFLNFTDDGTNLECDDFFIL